MRQALLGASLIGLLAALPAAGAEETVATYRMLTVDGALKAARQALETCRKDGFQVSVAVVDRMGTPLVMLRDRFAGPHTPETATRKAWTAVSFRSATGQLAEMAKPGTAFFGMHHVPGALVLGGGIVVEGGGSIVGGIGVSGAPGGDRDEACAKAGLAAIEDDINF